MSEFHERLRLRKEQILSDRNPSPSDTPRLTELDIAGVDRDWKWDRFMQGLTKVLVGACIFMGIFSYLIFKDWYGFVGSKEYADWKQRTER